MRVVITGGYGFIGSALAAELLTRGTFRGQQIDQLVLTDQAVPDVPRFADDRVVTVAGDLIEVLPTLFQAPVYAVFHLASAVSAECERDLDLGLRTNLDAMRALLQAARGQVEAGGPLVTVVFSSSVAVYGSDPALPLPDLISEATLPMPQSSYGAQKVACELLLIDYTRKGLVDGRVVRLMTVAIRPGKPNAAASGFVSGIVREPLAGLAAVCPVGREVALAIASPRRTVTGLLTIAEAERGDAPGQLSGRLPVNLPALTLTVGAMLDALRTIAGDAVADLVVERPDPAIAAIVSSWPARLDSTRAARLGLEPDPDIGSVIRQYLADHPDAIAR